MAWKPISNTAPQYHAAGSPASGYVLKFYASGTTTAISMATDATGGTLLASCGINTEGYPVNGSNAVFIPHINQPYKLALFTNQTDADDNATGNAAWVVDTLTHEVENTSVYELSSDAASASHVGISAGHIVEGNYFDSSRVVGSGGVFRFTGTTSAADAGNWPDSDGYFYDADGKQFDLIPVNGKPNLSQYGVGSGSTSQNVTRTRAAISRHSVVVAPAAFTINNSITIGDGQGIVGEKNDDGGSVITFDYSVTGKPIIIVSGRNCKLLDLELTYDSLPPDTDTEAFCVAFDDAQNNTAWGDFRNLYLHQCYGGVGEKASSSANVFNNVFSNIKIRNFSGWGWQIDNMASSGNHISAIYINNNWDRGSGLQPNDCVGMFSYQGGVNGLIDGLNCEWGNCSSTTPVLISSDQRLSINQLYLEGLTYTQSAPAAIAIGGAGSMVTVDNVYLNSVTADATQSTFEIIRFSGGSRCHVKGLTVESDCDFSAVTGDVSWLNLASSVDPAAGSEYEVTFAEDQSGDIEQIARVDVANDIIALKRFNTRRYFYEARQSITDDGAYNFTPTQPQGLMMISADNDVTFSALVFYNVNAGGAQTTLVAGTNAEVTTGALSGSTGTDNKVTVSAHTNGRVYIENRSGSQDVFVATILAGYDQ